MNLGPTLAAKFNVADVLAASDGAPGGTDCLDLPTSADQSLALSRSEPLSRTAYADTYSATGTSSPQAGNRRCPVMVTVNGVTTFANEVHLPIQDEATLNAYIAGLTAVGATSINAGMEWGAALIDPSMQRLSSETITAGDMPATMAGRPLAYGAEDSMKVIVPMTDGEHFAEERMPPASHGTNYKVGASTLWRASDGRYSIYHASRVDWTSSTTICNSKPYYVFASGSSSAVWQQTPWTGATPPPRRAPVSSPTPPPGPIPM